MKTINVSKENLNRALSPILISASTIKSALSIDLAEIHTNNALYGNRKACGVLKDGRFYYVSKSLTGMNVITILNKVGVTRFWADGHKEYYRNAAAQPIGELSTKLIHS